MIGCVKFLYSQILKRLTKAIIRAVNKAKSQRMAPTILPFGPSLQYPKPYKILLTTQTKLVIAATSGYLKAQMKIIADIGIMVSKKFP